MWTEKEFKIRVVTVFRFIYDVLNEHVVHKMVRRSERVIGSRTRTIKSNNDDPIVIDDAEVYVMFYVVSF